MKVIGVDKFNVAVVIPSEESGDHFSIEYKNDALLEYYGMLDVNPKERCVILEDQVTFRRSNNL